MDMIHGYPVAPGHCFVCGNSDQAKPVMDMGLPPSMGSRRMHIYLCGDCVIGSAMKVAPEMGYIVVSTETWGVMNDTAKSAEMWEAKATEAEEHLQRIAAFAKQGNIE